MYIVLNFHIKKSISYFTNNLLQRIKSYQILFLYILTLLFVPLIFYWSLWDTYIDFFLDSIYTAAERL